MQVQPDNSAHTLKSPIFFIYDVQGKFTAS